MGDSCARVCAVVNGVLPFELATTVHTREFPVVPLSLPGLLGIGKVYLETLLPNFKQRVGVATLDANCCANLGVPAAGLPLPHSSRPCLHHLPTLLGCRISHCP